MGAPKGRAKPKGAGRRAGTPNQVTKELKDMIMGALEAQGGQQYLELQAVLNPGPFMSLIAKLLPKDVALSNKDGEPLHVTSDPTIDAARRVAFLLYNGVKNEQAK
jgi:hypothetical protein